MKRVSVIIPVYNNEKTIRQAIDSALIENIVSEVIVIDDGSTDKSIEVVKSIHDDRIKLYPQIHRGVAAARNTGISISSGSHLAFLDADDFLLPKSISIRLEEFERNNDVSLVCGYAHTLQTNDRITPLTWFPNEACIIFPDILFIQNNKIATPTVMVSKSSIDASGGFDESMFFCEDIDLWARLIQKGRGVVVKKPLAVIRGHDVEVSKHYIQSAINSRIALYNKHFLHEKKLNPIYKRLMYEMYMFYFKAILFSREITMREKFRLLFKALAVKSGVQGYVIIFFYSLVLILPPSFVRTIKKYFFIKPL